MTLPLLDRRPIVVAIAGPNGAGKTTFYHAHVKPSGLRLVNADVLAGALDVDPYDAARLADPELSGGVQVPALLAEMGVTPRQIGVGE